jgi:hypothetical protein
MEIRELASGSGDTMDEYGDWRAYNERKPLMAERGRAREFRFPQITFIDYKHIEIDRTLLNLFPRLKYKGYLGRFKKLPFQLTIEKFTDEFTDEKNKDRFVGFAQHKEIVRKWLETDLLDLVNRGRPGQAVVSPRPLHGNIYKFRNSDHARDYNSAEQIYWMLHYARRGQDTLEELKRFLFPDMDWNLDKVQQNSATIDIETQAIFHLDNQIKIIDQADSHPPESYPPLCQERADIFAEDILRLLSYEDYIPRSVLVDYLKTLFAFHLALYHLHIIKLLPELVKRPARALPCQVKSCSLAPGKAGLQASCPYHTGLLVEMGDAGNTHMLELARRSTDTHYRRIPAYIQAQLIIKNLHDMAVFLKKTGKAVFPPQGYLLAPDILQYQENTYKTEREKYFNTQLQRMIEKDEEDGGTLSPEVRRVTEMGLSDFEAYIEILMVKRCQFHRRYITECIDSLLLKNRENGLLRQSRTRESPRRFSLGSRLLEVLLQIAVLTPQGTGFVTREIRVDDLLAFLRERYGLYIDCLPPGEGFEKPGIADYQALSRNKEAFKMRLREIGFFQDLSDAYVTQTVTPRYTITPEMAGRKNVLGRG